MKNLIKITIAATTVFTVSMMAFGINAMAYIDPSVTTYLIQAVAGIVVVVGAAAGLYFRKVRRKINEKLGIDENRNKEVESDVIEIKKDEN